MFEIRLGVETLKSADALITTSLPWAKELKDLYKRKEVYAITHGFDPERLNEKETALTSKFTVTYTEKVYAGKQNPSKLLIVLRDLIGNGTIRLENVEVRFYVPGCCVVRSRDCGFMYFVPEQTVMMNPIQGKVALPK